MITVVADAKYPNMYRVRLADGTTSDMLNHDRAQELARLWAATPHIFAGHGFVGRGFEPGFHRHRFARFGAGQRQNRWILIPPFPGSNPGAPASQCGLCGVISRRGRTADISEG
jgi:hypothetical protein